MFSGGKIVSPDAESQILILRRLQSTVDKRGKRLEGLERKDAQANGTGTVISGWTTVN